MQKGRHGGRLGALIVCAAVGGLLAANLRGDSGDSLVPPTQAVLNSDGATRTGTPAPLGREGTQFERVTGLAARGDTIVAVGHLTYPAGGDEQPIEPRIWRSVDRGKRWLPIAAGVLNRDLALEAVIVDGGRFLVAGWQPGGPEPTGVLLSSGDGFAWAQDDFAGAGVQLKAAATTATGVVLAGTRQDARGAVPVAFVSSKGGWRAIELPLATGASDARVLGACTSWGTTVTLVGDTWVGSTRSPYAVRSIDGGQSWKVFSLPGPGLVGNQAQANGCAADGGRTAVAGTAVVGGEERAFVSVERDGRWMDAVMLGPGSVTGAGTTSAWSVAVLGRNVIVAGSDSSTFGGDGELATWRDVGGEWQRLDALDALGTGFGPAEARAAIVHEGVLVLGGTNRGRAVVWRTSLQAADAAPGPAPAPVEWSPPLNQDELCALLTRAEVKTAVGNREVLDPIDSPEFTAPTVACTWRTAEGEIALQVQLAPPRNLDVLAADFPPGMGTPHGVSGVCDEGTATFYPGFKTLVARCGTSAVAVAGAPLNRATTVMKLLAKRLTAK